MLRNRSGNERLHFYQIFLKMSKNNFAEFLKGLDSKFEEKQFDDGETKAATEKLRQVRSELNKVSLGKRSSTNILTLL